MKRLFRWCLVLLMAVFFCFPAFAADDSASYYVDSFNVQGGVDGYYRYYAPTDASAPVMMFRYHYTETVSRVCFFSSEPFSLLFDSSLYGLGSVLKVSSPHSFGSHTFYFNGYNFCDSSLPAVVDFFSLGVSDSILDSVAEYYFSGEPFIDVRSGSGSSSQNFQYDSSIPAPQNLQFKATKKGLFGIGGFVHSLTWTNALVSDYSVRISAVIEASDPYDASNPKKLELMVCSDGSDGADAGTPASAKQFSYSVTDFEDQVNDLYGGVCGWEVKQYRVQFYRLDGGLMSVGPVGVINIEKNSAGIYTGMTVTTEYPSDPDNLGDSGGFFQSDSSDMWSNQGSHYDSFDTDGNPVGSGTVGDSSSGSGSGSSSTGNPILDFISGFANIPTIIQQFFNSLRDMLSGIGEFPALLASLFSFLPVEIIALIGLGLSLAVVLRIVGR